MMNIKSVRQMGRDALLFIFGQTISGIGDMAQLVGLSLYVYRASDNIFAVSALYAIEALSMIIFGQLGGLFADKWDRKRSLVSLQLLQALLIGLLPFFGRGVALYLLFFLFTVCTSISRVFQTAISGDLVAQEHYERFQGLYSSLRSSTVVLGPLVGSWLFTSYGTNALFSFNALSFVICAVTLMAISGCRGARPERPGAGKPGLAASWLEGYRVLMSNPSLAAVVLSMPVVMMGTGILNSVFIGISTDLWGLSDRQFGMVMAASGIGGIFGGLVYGNIHSRIQPKRLFHTGLLAKSAVLLAAAYTTNFLSVFLLLVFNSLFFSLVSSVAGVLLLRGTSSLERGRVAGIANSMAFIAMLLGSSVSGFFVLLGGYRFTIITILAFHLLCSFSFWLVGSRGILKREAAGAVITAAGN
ncbi:MAG: major facilitator superfamily protein [Elusimicrobia bacterium]|nr:MAG: major facilitator superfamily protein [Elusimicrobiota bacterium]KAF0153697.1 MAG: major facilitator superfamily protein [Elusimicrobiota bacterium]